MKKSRKCANPSTTPAAPAAPAPQQAAAPAPAATPAPAAPANCACNCTPKA